MTEMNEGLRRKLRAMFEDQSRTQYGADELREAAGTVPEGGAAGGGASAGGDVRAEGAAGEGRAVGPLDLNAMRVLLPELRERRERGRKVDLLPEAKPLFLDDARPVDGLEEGEDYRLDFYRGGDPDRPLRSEDHVREITGAGEYRLCVVPLSGRLRGSQVVPFEVGRRKRPLLPWLAALLALLAALGAGAALYLNGVGPWYDPNAGEGIAGLSHEDLQALLDAKVEEGMMNVTLATPIKFPDGTLSPGEAGFNNLEQNHYDQKLVLTLDETREVLYESGAIAPGQNIHYLALSRALSSGVHAATATITSYDRQTHEEMGSVSLEVTLLVG